MEVGKIVEVLKTLVPEGQVNVNQAELEQHSRDESYHTPHLPDLVVFPEE